MNEQVMIDAYVMIPITIKIDAASCNPKDYQQRQEWLVNQIRNGIVNFTDSHLQIEDSFVDVCSLSVGTESHHRILSEYHQREVFKELKLLAEQRLATCQKVKELCDN